MNDRFPRVDLDLRVVQLYGYENPKSRATVERYIAWRAIDVPPRVLVCQLGTHDFVLLGGVQYGGHHRALAAYHSGNRFLVRVGQPEDRDPYRPVRTLADLCEINRSREIPLQDIVLVDGECDEEILDWTRVSPSVR